MSKMTAASIQHIRCKDSYSGFLDMMRFLHGTFGAGLTGEP
jgi:hypothetical protein